MDIKIPKAYYDGAIAASAKHAWLNGFMAGLVLGALIGVVVTGIVVHYVLRMS